MSKTTVSIPPRHFRLALIGNPYSGKSSVFNRLTGLRQKVGNFPGITVDKKVGHYSLPSAKVLDLIDFPGAYSLYPTAQDERIVVQTLANPLDENYPDAVLYVADFTRLEKHLLLFTQIRDLGLPVILGLNMADMAAKQGRQIDREWLSKRLGVPVVIISSHSGQGFVELEAEITRIAQATPAAPADPVLYRGSAEERKLASALQPLFPDNNPYQNILIAHHHKWLPFLAAAERQQVAEITQTHGFNSLQHQVEETMARFDGFGTIVRQALRQQTNQGNSFTGRIDDWLTNRWLGPLIFLVLMFFIFQSIYAWAAYPMEAIEWLFGQLNEAVKAILPAGWFTNLVTDGLLAGLGGVLVFIPQIAILFFLITLLEEVGYMARAAFMFDRLLHFFGLNGRSLVALISSGACAIPAIMSTRNIANRKERMITILVAPFISCSARLPVYVVLIGFVVPNTGNSGFFNAQGLAFMGLYLLGIFAALGTALIFKYIFKSEEPSLLMLELPEYRQPLLRNVGLTVYEKVRSFLVEAGKVILVISVILWALASYGPAAEMAAATAKAEQLAAQQKLDSNTQDDLTAALRLEASYAGHLGKWIEPAIRPLGFDWKMGVAIICSFAAREVFVGTMATLYSVGSTTEELSIHDRLAQERDPLTGEKVYSQATALSLVIFYVFAMMCMSTLAVVKRETGSWKWPAFQFVFMTALAYLSSFLVYQWVS